MNQKHNKLNIVMYYFPTGTYDQVNTCEYNMKDALVRMGHTVITVDPLSHLGHDLPRYRYDEFIVDHMKKELKKRSIHLFCSMVRDGEITPDAVKCIKELGIPTVNIIWDIITTSDRIKKIAKMFDVFWVPNPGSTPILKTYGVQRPFVTPSASNPNLYYPMDCKEDVDISFCGKPREGRPTYIKSLFENGITVNLYGQGWENPEKVNNYNSISSKKKLHNMIKHIKGSLTHTYGRRLLLSALIRRLHSYHIEPSIQAMIGEHAHGPLSFQEMVRMFSRSKMSLGFNELGHTYLLKEPISEIRLRDFEAPMSGACHLMYRVPQMLGLFEEGKEMLFYSSIDELVDKIKYYLSTKRDSERTKIKMRARKRSLQDHTWANRWNQLFNELGI